MSDSNRLLIAAAAIGVIFCALVWGANGMVTLASGQHRPPEYTRIERQAAPNQQSSERTPASLMEEACAQAAETPADDPNNRERRDLCAQFMAANAANRAAYYTEAQTWIGAFGLGFVLITMLLNLGATVAAIVQARVARQTLEGIERPVIFPQPHSVALEEFDNIPGRDDPITHVCTLSFDIKNYGRTPAIVTEIDCRIGIGDPHDPFVTLPRTGPGRVHGDSFVLVPNDSKDAGLEFKCRLSDKHISALRNLQMLRFSGAVMYDDAAGIRREYVFLWNWSTQTKSFGSHDPAENYDQKTKRLSWAEWSGASLRAHRKKFRVGPYYRRRRD